MFLCFCYIIGHILDLVTRNLINNINYSFFLIIAFSFLLSLLKDFYMIPNKIDVMLTKITTLFILSSVPAGFFSVFQSITGWYFDNMWFMSFVAIAIFIDHAVGTYIHWKIKKDFSWRKNRDGLYIKIFGSIAGYILFEMFYQIVEDVNFIAMYLKVLLQVATFTYPAMSALVNISIATKGKYPPKGILSKFIKFEETGNLQVFKNIEDEIKINDSADISSDSPDGVPQSEENGGNSVGSKK